MFNLTKTTVAAGIIAIAALGGTPALADQHVNPLANAPTMPKDVTDTVIGSVDLAKEIMAHEEKGAGQGPVGAPARS